MVHVCKPLSTREIENDLFKKGVVSFPLDIKQTHNNKHDCDKQREEYLQQWLSSVEQKNSRETRKTKIWDDLANCTVHEQYNIEWTLYLNLNETVFEWNCLLFMEFTCRVTQNLHVHVHVMVHVVLHDQNFVN